MKSIEKNKRKVSLCLGLLIFVALMIVSCGGQEAVEESAQEVAESQEEIKQFEKELSEKEEVITELRERNAELENQMPMSYEVRKGDSHWEVAYDYLTRQKGLPAEEAVIRLSDTLLYHPIMAGFKIWNYFSDETFGSFITQGAADVSPGAVMRLKKKEAEEEKIGMESQITDLQNRKQDLIEKMDRMQKDHEVVKTELNNRISSLKNNLNEAEVEIQVLEVKLNSVYHLVGSKEELKDQGKIRGSFLGICGTRIKDVTFADFQGRIDLRETDSVAVNASDFGVSQIKKVELLPKYLEDGQDYRIEIAADRQSARVILLNKEKFRLARIIVILS
jgi:DNA repair exonuclease SbcCD ATPase subunit